MGFGKFAKVVALNIWVSVALGSSTFGKINFDQKLSGQKAPVMDRSVVWAQLGQTASLMCKSPNSEPIVDCLWERANSDFTTTKFHVLANDSLLTPGYSSNITEFSQGKCGITIQAVTEKDYGVWNCTLVTKSCEKLTGTVQCLQMDIANKLYIILFVVVGILLLGIAITVVVATISWRRNHGFYRVNTTSVQPSVL